MNTSHKKEKQLLQLSIYGALLLAVIAIIWGFLISSQMVVFDGLYSLISVKLSFLSLLSANFIRKRDSKRFPFGKQMVEPIVLLVKYTAILLLCITAIISSGMTLFSGGAEVNFGYAMLYALLSTVLCFGVYMHLKKESSQLGFVQAEANQWKMDMYLSAAVLLGFIVALLVSSTSYAHFTPYIDPLMVIIVAGAFLKVPITEMVKACREILEMAPEESIQANYEQLFNTIKQEEKIEKMYVRLAKVGGTLFVEVDFILNEHSLIQTVDQQDDIREKIKRATDHLPYQKWLTISFTKDEKWAV
ncbi:cation diffusion facilitator family transporter [Alkalihalobacillus hemicellulosilyticus]|uniref:Cobalt-zinc-cadmium resistance protein n=1 Tax=Halalkalibacter hemicellulosilyticusJCM 9152 TaxID=1236971 RepID=W4QH89_9BACI|nr:cation transporter [Halalkalibacter hemicellulosilyticus]GAE31292.1 cobalt-zinc-cadmium resistance protein [Halalkalibacter hemicellulosilyticusJCM 9152]